MGGESWDGPAEFRRAARLAQLAGGLDAVAGGLAMVAVGPGGPTPVAPGAAPADGGWASAGREAAVDRWPE